MNSTNGEPETGNGERYFRSRRNAKKADQLNGEYPFKWGVSLFVFLKSIRICLSLHWRTIVHTITNVKVEWDPSKAAENLRTHGVGFAEAVTVLEDDFALTRDDPCYGEERFVTLSLSNQGNLLAAVYTFRDPDTIRLISGWKANKQQRGIYEKSRR
jgi:uncharacterized protein